MNFISLWLKNEFLCTFALVKSNSENRQTGPGFGYGSSQSNRQETNTIADKNRLNKRHNIRYILDLTAKINRYDNGYDNRNKQTRQHIIL